jgi:hypothetical protein
MRGRIVALSATRRLTADLMRLSASVPTIPIVRRMNLDAVVKARANNPVRPPWSAIFVKAFAMVADEVPVLRRTYVRYPWAHLYEYPTSVAVVAVEREFEGELGVFFGIIKNPSSLELDKIGGLIREFVSKPVNEIKHFRRAIALSRFPEFIRRALLWIAFHSARQRANFLGTFVVSVVSALGADITHPRSAVTSVLNYGPIAPDGAIDVRLIFDHRVFDGAAAARVLERIEQVLKTRILGELTSQKD